MQPTSLAEMPKGIISSLHELLVNTRSKTTTSGVQGGLYRGEKDRAAI